MIFWEERGFRAGFGRHQRGGAGETTGPAAMLPG